MLGQKHFVCSLTVCCAFTEYESLLARSYRWVFGTLTLPHKIDRHAGQGSNHSFTPLSFPFQHWCNQWPFPKESLGV